MNYSDEIKELLKKDKFKYLRQLNEKELLDLLVLCIYNDYQFWDRVSRKSNVQEILNNNNFKIKSISNYNDKLCILIFSNMYFKMCIIEDDYTFKKVFDKNSFSYDDCSFYMQRFMTNKFGYDYTDSMIKDKMNQNKLVMNRNEAKNRLLELLDNDNFNIDYFQNLFKKYNIYSDSENTIISPLVIDNSNKRIVILESAYKKLKEIQKIVNDTKKDISYFMDGEEKTNGVIVFKTVIPILNDNNDFKKINSILTYKPNKYDINKKIICYGHTNQNSLINDNFSFGDLVSYIQFNSVHKINNAFMIMTSSGDFNFIKYEDTLEFSKLNKFDKVYLKLDAGKIYRLHAYSKGNYLNIDNELTKKLK